MPYRPKPRPAPDLLTPAQRERLSVWRWNRQMRLFAESLQDCAHRNPFLYALADHLGQDTQDLFRVSDLEALLESVVGR